MAGKGIFGRLRGLLSRGNKDQAPDITQGPSEADASLSSAAEEPQETPKIDLLLEALERQTALFERLFKELQRFSSANESLAGVARSMASADASTGRSMAELAERNEELGGELRSLVAASGRQVDLLQQIQADLTTPRQAEADMASALTRLSQSLETLNRSNSAHVELMEQIRDRLVGANEELDEIISRQGKRLTWLLLGVIVMLAALAAVIAIRGVFTW